MHPTWGRLVRATPTGFLGMILLVGLVENRLARDQVDVLPPIQQQWRAQGRESRGEGARADVLCLGDSLVTYGVLPAVIEGRLGRPAYNLSLGGGQFPANYFFLRRALDSGARPSALVVDALPLQLKVPAGARVELWSNILTARESLEVAWAARDSSFLASVLLAEHLTSWQSRLEIRRQVVAGFEGKPLSYREINRASGRNLRANRGALMVPRTGNLAVEARHHNWIYPGEITFDPVNEVFLERFLDLAGSRGIPVFWLLTPVCPEIQARGESIGAMETQARFLRKLQQRHPGVIVVDGRRSRYPESALNDSMHLAPSGAAVFSADLAEVLAQGYKGPRWVDLPPFRDRLVDFPHEDLAESTRALNAPLRR